MSLMLARCRWECSGNAQVSKRTVQELCASRGGRPGLLVPNSPYGIYGCKAILKRMLKLEKLLIRAAPNPTSDV